MARGLFFPSQASQHGDFLIFCIKSITFIPQSSPTACPATPALLQPPAATTKKLLEAWGGRKPLHRLSSEVHQVALPEWFQPTSSLTGTHAPTKPRKTKPCPVTVSLTSARIFPKSFWASQT